MYKNNYPHKRYRITLEFLKKYIDTNDEILDLGVENPFSKIMNLKKYLGVKKELIMKKHILKNLIIFNN